MKIFTLIAALSFSMFAEAGDRLICAGGNHYWGGGIFEVTVQNGICAFQKFTGYEGLEGVDDPKVTAGSSQDYNALVSCKTYTRVTSDEKGPFVLVRYPGFSHGGNVPRSSEKVRCKWNPDLPASLLGLNFSYVIQKVSE